MTFSDFVENVVKTPICCELKQNLDKFYELYSKDPNYEQEELDMNEREYIIENITKEEMEILEDNGINWCPDDMFGKNKDAIIFGEDEYDRAMELLGRK